MRPSQWISAAVLVVLVSFSAYAQTKKIVFVAGPKDHGAPGRHEHEKDLRVLAYSLENSSNLKGVTTQVIVGQVPRDLSQIRDAAVIVLESSSDRAPKETHALFPNNAATDGKTYDAETTAFLNSFGELLKKGTGLVVFHYATWPQNEAGRQYYLDWLGGYYKQGVSANPVDDWTMTPKAENHPILRGVKPWTYREEVFSKFVLPEEYKTIPLLIGTPAKKVDYGPQVASWAYERPGGGRGFVMGGLDWHSNMLIEDNRRFLLNGIVWAAGMEVPAGGVASTLPEGMVPK
ncbi:MAG: ThuA domain-containing protein [Bryobacteraceae bacterium]